jgi:pyruvate dehydrogenase E1 component alpha subunit
MRYYGHFEGDAATYKSPDEVAKYKATNDPLSVFRNRVTQAHLLDGKTLDEIDKKCKQRIHQCVATAKSSAVPSEADLLTDVYTSAY